MQSWILHQRHSDAYLAVHAYYVDARGRRGWVAVVGWTYTLPDLLFLGVAKVLEAHMMSSRSGRCKGREALMEFWRLLGE